jgi:disulfide bond formation protein DsbB
MTSKPIKPANAAFASAFLMFAALCGAWFFQYQLGYAPCPLCYQQRIPYYFAIPLGLLLGVIAIYGSRKQLLRYGLYLLALVLMVSAGMGVYHAGVEWGFWQGPTSCAASAPSSAPIGNILESLGKVRAVPCNEAAWRLFGISLAGYNALISAAAAIIALAGARRA